MITKHPEMNMHITILHLYPKLMNIYGDRGNIITLVNRCRSRDIAVDITTLTLGDNLDHKDIDLFFGGGGQDKQQKIVSPDLLKRQEVFMDLVSRGIPGLLVCGTYQLFGNYFKTAQGEQIDGLGILDLYTEASSVRKIGNVLIDTTLDLSFYTRQRRDTPTSLIGFENHSGNTYLSDAVRPLGTVRNGFGNNGEDGREGAIHNHVIGTYLHGPLLPKNPHLADYLIFHALKNKYRIETLQPIDDTLEWQAHNTAINRL